MLGTKGVNSAPLTHIQKSVDFIEQQRANLTELLE